MNLSLDLAHDRVQPNRVRHRGRSALFLTALIARDGPSAATAAPPVAGEVPEQSGAVSYRAAPQPGRRRAVRGGDQLALRSWECLVTPAEAATPRSRRRAAHDQITSAAAARPL
jgi:hypothetical protein